jgi:signal transduction histidine kinase
MMPAAAAVHAPSLSRQLLVGVGALVLAMLTALIGLAYWVIGQRAESVARTSLLRQVSLQAQAQGQMLAEGERSVRRLHATWQARAQAASAPAVAARFSHWFAPGADGVWRLKPQWVSLATRPTFYLQPGPAVSEDTRFRAVLSLELLSEQGPALVPPFFSAYVDFVEKGLMVYSPDFDWGAGATPQTDNFGYPTMQGSDPARNPRRSVFWTPVYFDAEAKTWMVSVIHPLDWQGRWVGTVGHDLSVDRLRRDVGVGAGTGVVGMVLSRKGELIAHRDWAQRIDQAEGQLALSRLNDPMLDAVYQQVQRSGAEPQVQRTPDGRYWVASAGLPGPGWWTVLVLPQAVIDAEMRQFAAALLALGLGSAALMLWALRRVVRQTVTRPLRRLHAGVAALAEQRRPEPLALAGPAELAQLGDAFDHMAAALEAEKVRQRLYAQELVHQVAERKEAEQAVRELNLALERVVAERTQALSETNQRLAASVDTLQRAQQELVQQETLAGLGAMVAGVSHELNTPLGNALIAADTVQARLRELAQELVSARPRRSLIASQLEQAQQAVALACGNLQRSVDLVAGFKQVAVDRAGLQRRPFDLGATVHEVVALLGLSLRHPGASLDVDLPPGIAMDSYPGALGQVLTNLVQNAVLHGLAGREDGRVTVGLVSKDDDRVVLAVVDNGTGIAPEHLPHIFKPFFTTKLGQGGSGLGLHIVHNLVTGPLGGRIDVDSKKGQGTRFVLTLPLRAP